jgi:hypothetical protein
MPVPRYEIVGIVGDVRASIDQEPAPAMYRPLLDSANPAVSLLLHTQGDPQADVNTVRNEVRKFNSNPPAKARPAISPETLSRFISVQCRYEQHFWHYGVL